MPVTDVNLMGGPYAAQAMDIERRRKLAEMMQMQAQQPMESNVSHGPLGNVTAPNSWTQGLAKLLQSYVGAKGQSQALGEQQKLGEQYRTEGQQALVKGLQDYRGMPAETLPPDQPGPTRPEIPGSPETAMATWAGHPMTQGYSTAIMAHLLKGEDPYSLREGEKRFGPGGKVVAENVKPQPGFTLTPGATRFGPTGEPVANLPEKVDPNKPFIGVGKPNTDYQNYELLKAATGANRTNVNVDTKAESAYAQGVSGKAVDRDSKQYDAATAATDNIAKLDTIINHLKTSDAITGMGAEVLKNVERAKVLLANDKKAGKTVSDTEYLDALLGSEVFPMIQALGVGARGMDTPAEREFLRQSMAGTIPMNKDTLLRMTQIRKNIAQRAIDKFNGRVQSGELHDFFKYSKIPKAPIAAPEMQGGAPKAPAGPRVRRYNPATGQIE